MIEVKSLRKQFGSTVAVDGVDCCFPDRSLTTISGVSGSGKTTLLKMIGLMTSPTSGTILIDGVNYYEKTDEERALMRNKRIGFVFQDYKLDATYSVEENLEIPVVSTDEDGTVVDIDSTGLRVTIRPEKLHMEPKAGDMVLIGGRPEYLAVSAEDNGKSIPGTVRIIQHLGSFIRYEVEVSREISPVTFEVDMDSMQPGIHEGDMVHVTFDESRIALFSPEGREI